MDTPTAGIILIGNELLSGKIKDENTYFLTKELFEMGIKVQCIIMIPDEEKQIAETLKDLQNRVDVIFTSGGIGPTHDDITVATIAQTLGRPLMLNQDLKERASRIFGKNLGPQHLKMAMVPQGCKLIEAQNTRWPTLVLDNIYIFAGIPKILRRSFRAIRHLLPHGTANFVTTIFVSCDELTIAPTLETTIQLFPEIILGSYPVIDNPTYRVSLTLENTKREIVEKAAQYLMENLPNNSIVQTKNSSNFSTSNNSTLD